MEGSLNQSPSSNSVTSSTSLLHLSALRFTDQSRIIRTAFESFLKGCVIGNILDEHAFQNPGESLSIDKFQSIMQQQNFSQSSASASSSSTKPPNQEQKQPYKDPPVYDIAWHYLFFAEIYSLLEYDGMFRQSPLCHKSYLKYLLTMRITSNAQTQEQLSFLFPENSIQFTHTSTTPDGSDPQILNPSQDPKLKLALNSYLSLKELKDMKYIKTIQQQQYELYQFSSSAQHHNHARKRLSFNLQLKVLIPKILPIIFAISANSLKQTVFSIKEHLSFFANSEEFAPIIFYYIFMSKLLKYFINSKSNKLITISKLKSSLIKKGYNQIFLQTQHARLDKKVKKFQEIQKNLKYARINESSPTDLKQDYMREVSSLRKKSDYVTPSRLIIDVILMILCLSPIFSINEILDELLKKPYCNSVIPSLLLALPPLAILNPEPINQNYSLSFPIHTQQCILNHHNPSPWFSTEITTSIFSEFINIFSSSLYVKSA